MLSHPLSLPVTYTYPVNLPITNPLSLPATLLITLFLNLHITHLLNLPITPSQSTYHTPSQSSYHAPSQSHTFSNYLVLTHPLSFLFLQAARGNGKVWMTLKRQKPELLRSVSLIVCCLSIRLYVLCLLSICPSDRLLF